MKVLITAACFALGLVATAGLTLPLSGFGPGAFAVPALGLALAADSPAGAPAPKSGDRYAEMDVDGNGAVTWEEFAAAMPKMKRGAFDAIDKDKNGGISREEWEAFRAGHGSGGSMGGSMPGSMGDSMPGSMPASMPGSMPGQMGSKMGGMPPAGAAPDTAKADPAKPDILPPSKK